VADLAPPERKGLRRSRHIQKIDNTQYKSALLSMHEAAPAEKEVEETRLSPKKSENFNSENFLEIWHTYRNEQLAKGNAIMAAIMQTSEPQLEEGAMVHLKLHSKAEELEFEKGKIELLGFLRKFLHNDFLELRYTFTTEEVKGKPYHNDEKMRYLIEKHPLLADWIKALKDITKK
jgi:hypothetical protein